MRRSEKGGDHTEEGRVTKVEENSGKQCGVKEVAYRRIVLHFLQNDGRGSIDPKGAQNC